MFWSSGSVSRGTGQARWGRSGPDVRLVVEHGRDLRWHHRPRAFRRGTFTSVKASSASSRPISTAGTSAAYDCLDQVRRPDSRESHRRSKIIVHATLDQHLVRADLRQRPLLDADPALLRQDRGPHRGGHVRHNGCAHAVSFRSSRLVCEMTWFHLAGSRGRVSMLAIMSIADGRCAGFIRICSRRRCGLNPAMADAWGWIRWYCGDPARMTPVRARR
jgi:hypothetical protein